jgi:hypothetical protein
VKLIEIVETVMLEDGVFPCGQLIPKSALPELYELLKDSTTPSTLINLPHGRRE